MSSDIISLLQEARARVEKTKQAVNQAIDLTADVGKDNDELATISGDSEIRQAAREAYLTKLDRDHRYSQIVGIKERLIIQTANWNKLQNKAARFGGVTSAPLELQNDIESVEEIMAQLNEELKKLEADF